MLRKISELAKVTPADMNRLYAAINQVRQIKAAAPLNITVAGGIPQLRLSEQGWMAKTTASVGTGKYTVVEVQRSTGGAWTVVSDGRTLDAYEWNKKTGIKNGTIVRVEPFFDGDWRFFAGSGSGGGGGGGGAGDACGFLLDVPTYGKKFKLTIPSAIGRCECIDTTQGSVAGEAFELIFDDTAIPPVFVGDRTFATCCGCGRIKLRIPGDGTADATLDINQPCDEIPPTYTAPYTYQLYLEGCYPPDVPEGDAPPGGPYIILAGAGPKNCNSEPPECDNTFRVRLECLDCTPTPVECVACFGPGGPPTYLLDLADFTAPYLEYNGNWAIKHDPDDADCVWELECNGVSMVLTLTYDGVDTYTATLVLSGATGGSLTYTITNVDSPQTSLLAGKFGCRLGFNLPYDGEEVPTGAASSVLLRRLDCSCPCPDADCVQVAITNLISDGPPGGAPYSYGDVTFIGYSSPPPPPFNKAWLAADVIAEAGIYYVTGNAYCFQGEFYLELGNERCPTFNGSLIETPCVTDFEVAIPALPNNCQEFPPLGTGYLSYDGAVITPVDCPPAFRMASAQEQQPEAKPAPIKLRPITRPRGCGSCGKKKDG